MNQILLPSGKYIYDDVVKFNTWYSKGNHGAKGIEITYKIYPGALLLYTNEDSANNDLHFLREKYPEAWQR